MKRLFITLSFLIAMFICVNAQVKNLKLNADELASLLECAQVIQSIDNISSKQIDSVTNLHPLLQKVSKQDLNILYSFLVPQLIPQIAKNKEVFLMCEPYANLYTKKIEAGAAAIVSKYLGTTEKILLENLKCFFQLYLYVGLMHNNKLGILAEYQPDQISTQNLDNLFIAARGSAADNVIYFTMEHSYTNLFALICQEYNIPSFSYSEN